MIILLKFIKISPSTFCILFFLSIISGLLKSLSIVLLYPLMNLYGMDEGSSVIDSLYTNLFAIFSLDKSLISILFAMCIFSMLSASILYFTKIYTIKIIQLRIVKLRTEYIEAILNSSWTYLTKKKSGEILNTTIDQAGKVGSGFNDAVICLSLIFEAITMLVVSFYISFLFSVTSIFFSIFLILIFSLVDQLILKSSKEIRDKQKVYTVGILEKLNLIKSTLIMNTHKRVVELFNKETFLLAKAQIKLFKYQQIPIQFREMFIIIFIATITLVSSLFNLISFTAMVPLILIFQRVASYLGNAQNSFQSVLKMGVYFDDFFYNLNYVKNDRFIWYGKKEPEFIEKIYFESVSFNYDNIEIISNLNFTINKNDIFLIKGSSGVGKTTIIDLLVGLHKPSLGSINVDNNKLFNIDLAKWRKKISYIPQDPQLINSNIFENITLGDLDITNSQVNEALNSVNAFKFINKLEGEIEYNVGESGKKLSGGQKQRISIARGIVGDKDILICDEPTSALDKDSEEEILELFCKLKSKGKTIIIISHTSTYDRIADNILQL